MYPSPPAPFPVTVRRCVQLWQAASPTYPLRWTRRKIDETVMKYAMACKRMQKAGMDVALLHGGHGNLISQFTSPHYNKRTDKYGGSLENRARFAIEVVEKTVSFAAPTL